MPFDREPPRDALAALELAEEDEDEVEHEAVDLERCPWFAADALGRE